MSLVAFSPRPHPSGRAEGPASGRPDRAPACRVDPLRHPQSTPMLTVTVEFAPGRPTARLARLVELLRELVESGEGTVLAAPAQPRPLAAVTVRDAAEDPAAVRVLAASRVVRQGQRVIPLTRLEFDLLLFLARHPRRVFTRLELLRNVWGYEHATARTVDVHVRRLRAKFAGAPLVATVYGVGYRLADDAMVTVDPDG